MSIGSATSGAGEIARKGTEIWTGMPDEMLAVAAQRGEKRAFVEIVARYQAMVCGTALSVLGDFAASEDAAQEAFLTAWRKMGDLREPERLKAWLGKIARTSAQQYRRRCRGGAAVEEWADQTDPGPRPDEAAANGEEAEAVRGALAKMPETFRLPLILYYCDGQSVRRVAETLEVSEGAVKQRLARGRAMMRERVSGLIESVLTRARPTTVFTMAVAGAIGALTPPAVVAGTAFATTAGGGGIISTTTSTAVTAMSTAKSSLTIAALVAAVCLPLGYGAHQRLNPSPPEVQRDAATDKGAMQKAGPDTPGSAYFEEWKKLHERLGSTAAAMPLLYDAIEEIADPVRRSIFHAAHIAEWAEVAPKTGLTFFMERSSREIGRLKANKIHHGEMMQFFGEWLKRDADAAVTGLMTSEKDWKSKAWQWLPEIAKRAPVRLAEAASQLNGSSNGFNLPVSDAFAIMSEGSLESARSAAEGMTGECREQALAGVARVWARKDLTAAIEWAKSLPKGTNHDAVIHGALLGAASTRPQTALDYAKDIPAGGERENSIQARVLAEAAKSDYDATVVWLIRNASALNPQQIEGMNGTVSERIREDAAGFLNRHAADGSLTVLLPSISRAILNNIPVEGYRVIGEWLKLQPDNQDIATLRERTVAAMSSKEPEKALLIIADAPEAQRPGLTAKLAAWWAIRAPSVAAAWVTSLPAGGTRTDALNRVADTWIAQDAYGASEWITTLPAGADKDRAADGLVKAIATEAPEEAWQWTLAIGDRALRAHAALLTLTVMQKHDPGIAQQWLEALPVSAEEREQMRIKLDGGSVKAK